LFPNFLDGTADVGFNDEIDELRGNRGGGVGIGDERDRLLNFADQRVEVVAAGDFQGSFATDLKIDGGGNRATAGVAEDEDQLAVGDSTGILEAAKNLLLGDVAGNADAENIADAEVEEDFGGGSGVDAGQDSGEWVLAGSRPGHIAAEITIEPPPRAETLVAVSK